MLMFDGKYTSAELMFEKILIRFSSDIGAEERYCIKRASEKLIALYGDLDFKIISGNSRLFNFRDESA